MNNRELKGEDVFNRFFNPKLVVIEENLYSIVARTELESEKNRPYARLDKRKDNEGEFVITRTERKVHRKDWRYNHTNR